MTRHPLDQCSAEAAGQDPASLIEKAVSRAVDRYVADREQRIEGFVRRHYSLKGSLRLHGHALGWDLVRVPLNITWSVPRFLLYLLGLLAGFSGLTKVAQALHGVPAGLATDLDRRVGRLVVTDLLELPHPDVDRDSQRDALMEEILRDPVLEPLFRAKLRALRVPPDDPLFRRGLDRKLAEYGACRTGTSELAGNLAVLLSSQMALGQASFGALSAGSALAASVAKSAAVSGFWLGPLAGSWFYALVPVTPSVTTLLAAIAGLALVLALLSTFIGILTDPLQVRFGLHQRRLRRLLHAVRRDLCAETDGDFQLREKYVGRVMDVFDYLTALGRAG